METIECVLKLKGHDVWSIAPDASVYDAVKLMAEKGVGALVVLEADKLAGIISERDCAKKVILEEKAPKSTPVREIMTSHVIYTRPTETVENCLALMTARRIRHLPVLEDDRLVGLVSIGDLVKTILSRQKVLIQRLENYILEYTSIT